MNVRCFFLSLILSFGVAMPLFGQSYDALWKDVEAAMKKDQPRTALAAIDRLRDKALRDKADGQLLAAMLTRYQLADDLAPDSGRIVLSQLEAAAARETRPAARALWQCAVGRTLLQQGDTAARSRGYELLHHALDNPAALASARATNYLPLFVIGKDSRHFNNDLLSVVGKTLLSTDELSMTERHEYAARIIAYYRQAGDREATLLATLDSIKQCSSPDVRYMINSPSRRALWRVASEFHDLSLNVETYIALTEVSDYYDNSRHEEEDSLRLDAAQKGIQLYGKEERANVLRNVKADIEQPYATIEMPNRVLYPAKAYMAHLTAKNVSKLTFTCYHLKDLKATDEETLDGLTPQNFQKQATQKVFETNRSLPTQPVYHEQSDSIPFSFNETGIYYCTLTANAQLLSGCVVSVSRLLPLVLTAQDGKSHVRIVDAMSGTPVKDARVSLYRKQKDVTLQEAVYSPDETGEIVIPKLSGKTAYARTLSYYPIAGTDAYHPAINVRFMSTASSRLSASATTVRLYTDRAIYRPGQIVHFGGLAYTQQGDEVKATTGLEVRVSLLDVNHKAVADTIIKTDDFGQIGGKFVLPASCLTGLFRLTCNHGGNTTLRVEEYKRPTFTVETSSATVGYKLGDTVQLKGVVRTYAGVAIADARVKYNVQRYTFFNYHIDDEAGDVQNGEVLTDETGHFSLPIALSYDCKEDVKRVYVRYIVNIDVTASNGETVSAEQLLVAGQQRGRIAIDWPNVVCREDLPRLTATLTGADGNALPATIHWSLHRYDGTTITDTLSSGQARQMSALRNLVSGSYTLVFAAANADTVRRDFFLFSEQDNRLAVRRPFVSYIHNNERGDSTCLVVGTSADSVTLFYDLFAQGRRMESRVICFSDSLLRLPLVYRSEMGDGTRLVIAFAKDGEIYTAHTEVRRPEPDKRLTLHWKTFRSHLTPGQKETWTLCVNHPDGTPAEALIMARLYDASLDAFARQPWHFSLYFSRRLMQANWAAGFHKWKPSMTGTIARKTFNVPSLAFTDWDDRFFESISYGGLNRRYFHSSKAVALYATSALGATDASEAVMEDRSANDMEVKGDATMDTAAGIASNESAVTPRTNFAETAFFATALRTDEAGNVKLTFTLPESLTSWNFTALAHTRSMDYGRLDTTIVARKAFMVQPAMPRYVRRGDHVSLPVTVTNLSEKAVSGTMRLELRDAETEKVVRTLTAPFSAKAGGQTTKDFDFTADFSLSVLVCRVSAVAADFSDGEENYLPILADRVDVARSIPFSMTQAGTRTLRLDTLFNANETAENRRLTVEISSNPTWYAVAALPALFSRAGESTVDWATRYYAVTIAAKIADTNPSIDSLFTADDTAWGNVLQRNPELKQTLLAETPWVAEAETEGQRLAALHRLFNPQNVAASKFTALDHLKALQQTDGAWSWYQGMPTSTYITADVAVLLARLESLCGDSEAKELLDRAMHYLDSKMAEDVARLKKDKTIGIGIGSTHLNYLYARALRNLKPNATTNFLIERFEAFPRTLSMRDKALLSVVLAHAGKQQLAKETLQSLLEHTVSTSDMGRYFDTNRATNTPRSYRLPTQTASIEALYLVGTSTDNTQAEEMRLWLMQSKRTQMWETSRATADAVYALLLSPTTSNSYINLSTATTPLLYTLGNDAEILAINSPSTAKGQKTLGYYCQTYTTPTALAANRLTLRKTANGLSWGSVVAQYTLPLDAVTTSSSGLSVTRSFEVKRNEKWQAINANSAIAVGEHIRQVLTITADRDYDFVSVKAARPACLAPSRPLSGYGWTDGLGCYRAVGDASTTFFVERLSKGTHTLTEEYISDRTGRYACGISQVQSVYAPEFCGSTSSLILVVSE